MFELADIKKANPIIGIWLTKTAKSVALLLNLYKLKKAYCPMNTEWPEARIKFIGDKLALNYYLIDNSTLNDAKLFFSNTKLNYECYPFDSDFHLIVVKRKLMEFVPNMAYILFTSGSTGFPKGIIHSYSSMNYFLKWCKKEFSKFKIKKHISIAPLNFDLSIYDIFFSYLNHSTLFIPKKEIIINPRSFISYLLTHKIESLYCTPTFLENLLLLGRLNNFDFSFIKLILIAGEPLDYSLINRIRIHFTNATYYNLYGPTETNVCCFYKVKNKSKINGPVPIGKSIYPAELSVNSKNELVYKGKLLMSAYCNEKGIIKIKSHSKFNTGDMVIKVHEGFEFKGRRDQQVKRNGFRIELAEITSCLLLHKGIRSAETVNVKFEEHKILSFVILKSKLTELQIKEYCLQMLPFYMLPDRIIILDKFPLTLNQKVDIEELKNKYAQSINSKI